MKWFPIENVISVGLNLWKADEKRDRELMAICVSHLPEADEKENRGRAARYLQHDHPWLKEFAAKTNIDFTESDKWRALVRWCTHKYGDYIWVKQVRIKQQTRG